MFIPAVKKEKRTAGAMTKLSALCYLTGAQIIRKNRKIIKRIKRWIHTTSFPKKRNSPRPKPHRKIENYLFPAMGTVVLFFSFSLFSPQNIVVAVEYSGTKVGYVKDETEFTKVQQQVQQRVAAPALAAQAAGTASDAPSLDVEPKMAVALAPEAETADPQEISDELVKAGAKESVEASGLYVDGILVGATTEPQDLLSELDTMLETYTDEETQGVEFTNHIQLKSGVYPAQQVSDVEEIASVLSNSPRGRTALAAANPSLEVKVTKTEVTEQEIPYGTTYVDDPNYFKGYTELVSEGRNGVREITAQVVYINDQPIKTVMVQTKDISQPVNRVVKRGSRVIRTKTLEGKSWNVTFENPLPSGWLSADMEDYTGHTGIDLAAPRGTPVYASAGGTVVMAGWYGEYGYCVIIDHGEGVKTLYGHNSFLTVQVGQTVKQGEQIAKVGSTGNSTGNHVHFEIRVGSKFLDPLIYIGK